MARPRKLEDEGVETVEITDFEPVTEPKTVKKPCIMLNPYLSEDEKCCLLAYKEAQFTKNLKISDYYTIIRCNEDGKERQYLVNATPKPIQEFWEFYVENNPGATPVKFVESMLKPAVSTTRINVLEVSTVTLG